MDNKKLEYIILLFFVVIAIISYLHHYINLEYFDIPPNVQEMAQTVYDSKLQVDNVTTNNITTGKLISNKIFLNGLDILKDDNGIVFNPTKNLKVIQPPLIIDNAGQSGGDLITCSKNKVLLSDAIDICKNTVLCDRITCDTDNCVLKNCTNYDNRIWATTWPSNMSIFGSLDQGTSTISDGGTSKTWQECQQFCRTTNGCKFIEQNLRNNRCLAKSGNDKKYQTIFIPKSSLI